MAWQGFHDGHWGLKMQFIGGARGPQRGVGLVIAVRRRDWNLGNLDIQFHSGPFESLTTPTTLEEQLAFHEAIPDSSDLRRARVKVYDNPMHEFHTV